jgi:exonuclease III
MNSRSWHILCWNIRGLNALGKWDAVRDKIEESACSVICLQETKKEHFDLSSIRKFAPRRFDSFDFIPSNGASGGILVVWNGSVFQGTTLDKLSFGLTISFTSLHNAEVWKLSTVYGPCTEPERTLFIEWFRQHDIADTVNWIFLGDFNFYRSLNDRNRPGGKVQDTLVFNEAIGHLGLVELPLKGRAFTWSNMQANPLLEQLDWFFTSLNWTAAFPNTHVIPLAKITSDHVPCKVVIDTKIPKASIFRFENFWPQMNGFHNIVQDSWVQQSSQSDAASALSAKFKRLRYNLKNWSRQFSNIKTLIANCNTVILHLDALEDLRTLYNPEHNLRNIIKNHLAALLRARNLYWKNRYTENRIKFGDECTKFFHAMATITFRRNTIMH